MGKRRVKILVESIAGFGDVDRGALDRKYAKYVADYRKANPKVSQQALDYFVGELKKADRYDDYRTGMERDFAFKRDQEVLIPEALAEKWEAAGICSSVPDTGKKAA